MAFCTPQFVSAPRSLSSFRYPHLSFPLRSPECEYTLLARFHFSALICLSLRTLQAVSHPCMFACFCCPDMSLHLCSPVCECPSLAGWPSFVVLITPLVCTLQQVSDPCLLTFLPYPDPLLVLCSPGGQCPLLVCLLCCPDLCYSLHPPVCECSCSLSLFHSLDLSLPLMHSRK